MICRHVQWLQELEGKSTIPLQFDYALDKIDVSLLTDEVVFRVDTSNIPGYWDQVVDKAVSRRSVDRRDLKKRWWGEFTAWLADMNTIDIPLVHTVDVAGPKNFDYPLYQGSLSCPTGLTATASVGVSGTLSIPINYGVIILGTLLPVPDVSESYVFMDASASASIMFYAPCLGSVSPMSLRSDQLLSSMHT
ncbi:hypothetical protein B0H16DRAFT_822301 [Mycena metata]|uniref:Uncharacterized protein n=1 Tax=Mycena metata TaxID=1033252 RepID=A0AAD7IW20_9AGAR|nr:hypothetical protein B0H16DRAFT_822301 [Mycena metata]